MRYFIFSDVHGNLQALMAVLKYIRGIGYDRCICLGDTIGYGANPKECWEIVVKLAHAMLMGNHEYAILHGIDSQYNYVATASLLWTAHQLEEHPEITAAMNELPLVHVESGARFVHSSPFEPEEFHYVRNEDTARVSLNHFDEVLCFIGHTHAPMYCLIDSATHQSLITNDITYGMPIKLSPSMRCLVNVGSVGQPRDGDPSARFVTYDSVSGELVFHQVPYDIESAQRALMNSTLDATISHFLAGRLSGAR